MMLGFIVFKLFWVKNNEFECFNRIYKVFLFKDYLRFCLCGMFFFDMLDVLGIMWMNIKECVWDEFFLVVCGLLKKYMLELVEGFYVIGMLLFELV